MNRQLQGETPPLHVKGSILEHIMKPDTPGRQAVTVRRYDDI